jgi:phage terminase large subunit-like protein
MSGLRLDYYVLRYIHDRTAYRELVRARKEKAGSARNPGYFPLYRS